MASFMQKVLLIAERNAFLSTCGPGVDHYKFGPAGQLLKNNVSQEWFFSNAVDTIDSMFPFGQDFCKNPDWKGFKTFFEHAKRLTGSRLPFGFAELRPGYESPSPVPEGDAKAFFPRFSTLARTCKFERPGASTQLFDHWQKQRNIWWRKFSNSPGRFALSDMRTGASGQGQEVDIVANLPCGPVVVETIRQLGSQPFENMEAADRSIFELKDNRRLVLPHVVESCTSIEVGTLLFLCDAYEEKSVLEHPREVLCFHRRLAPYKVAFAAAPIGTAAQDIGELAGFLARVLRRAGVSTLLLPDFGRKSLESQHLRNDELGVPYCVVLNESALKNGIVGLRNRDTTLKEQVHVAELKKYVKLLIKNY